MAKLDLERKKMKIIRNEISQTWTLVPVEEGEAEVLTSFAAMLKPEDELSYGGRSGDDHMTCKLHLHVGASREPRTTTRGNVTIHRTVYVGGVELILRGTTETDKNEIWSVRYGAVYSGLIFLGETEVDGKKAIVVTAGRCKHCGAAQLNPEWQTCDACAAKCEHNYVKGAVHGGSTDIGVGEFCDICGRVKPRPEGGREKSAIEHHLEVEKELGIPVFHKIEGTPLVSSQDIVSANRLARRYTRSALKSLRRNVSA